MSPLVQYLPPPVRRFLAFVGYVARRYLDDRCSSTAATLTYTGLLALVPLTTIGYALLSAFPAFQAAELQMQDFIFRTLVPQVGSAVQEHLTTFTAAAGKLTVFGLVGLAVSAILVFFTVESAFNDIFRVKRERRVMSRVLIFWAGLTLTPMLLAASVSLSGGLHIIASKLGVSGLISLGGDGPLSQFLLLLLEAGVFALFYIVVPNRPVLWSDALIGGAIGAILLEISKEAFAFYVAGESTYKTVYGALALIPTVLLWLYIAASTILIGAELTAALPEWRSGYGRAESRRGLKPAERLGAALLVLDALTTAQIQGQSLPIKRIERRVQLSGPWLDETLTDLAAARMIAESADRGWLIARNLADVTLYDLREALGLGAAGLAMPGGLTPPWLARFTGLIDQADDSDRSLLSISVKDMLTPGAS